MLQGNWLPMFHKNTVVSKHQEPITNSHSIILQKNGNFSYTTVENLKTATTKYISLKFKLMLDRVKAISREIHLMTSIKYSLC
jgi:hypothetical protein